MTTRNKIEWSYMKIAKDWKACIIGVVTLLDTIADTKPYDVGGVGKS